VCKLLTHNCKQDYTGTALAIENKFPFKLMVGTQAIPNVPENICV